MRNRIALALMTMTLASLTACATTSGAIPMGPDTYLLTREGGSGFVGSAGVRNDALKEASAYCQKDGLKFMIVSMSEQGGGPGRYPRADINFKCLRDGDRELVRPNLQPVANTVVEVR